MTDDAETDAGTAVDPSVTAVRLVRGNPTAEEIAAVTAVVAAALEAAASVRHDAVPEPSHWSRTQRSMREPLHPGPGEWRASAF